MMGGPVTSGRDASFDLTPMIDVVLLLIIFFMLSSQFANTQLTPMDLPVERGVDAPEDAGWSLVIEMDKDGKLTVLGQPTTLESLPALVGPASRDAAHRSGVTVRADRHCPAVHLNRLADTLAGLGIRDWGFATASEGAPGPAGPPRTGSGS